MYLTMHGLFNDALNDRMIDEWKEMIVTYFMVLSTPTVTVEAVRSSETEEVYPVTGGNPEDHNPQNKWCLIVYQNT
jgi:hypothetical protein